MLSPAEHCGEVLTAAAALLLAWAALPRIRDRAAAPGRRITGALELLIAVAVLVLPGPAAAVLAAAVFALFCALHLRDLLTGGDCECFDPGEQVPPARAAALTAAVALGVAGAAAVGAPSLAGLVAHDPVALAWAPTASLLLALGWRVLFSGPQVLTAIGRGTGQLLEGGPMAAAITPSGDGLARRSFLLRVAVVGSALAVAPIRYLLYPGTALASVVGPWDCAGGLCTDGYTGFCCEINQGGANTCPTGTFAGGWWMCTDYSGRQLCSEQGVRYYVDCNALPGHPFHGGCRCANDNCNERKIACNIFRYGQCNTHIEGVTAVVCRMITCENPSTIDRLHCSSALATDDATCGHEAPCLEPRALEYAGAGGV